MAMTLPPRKKTLLPCEACGGRGYIGVEAYLQNVSAYQRQCRLCDGKPSLKSLVKPVFSQNSLPSPEMVTYWR